VGLSRELLLVADCCSSAFARGHPRIACTAGEIDWSLFLELVRFHRVQGLVHAGLQAADRVFPNDVTQAIAADSDLIAASNLRAALESRELLAEFERAGVPLLFVKGLTLGTLVYGNPVSKAAIDIDLLVSPDSLPEAIGLLERLGYRTIVPNWPATQRRLLGWHRLRKESAWVRKGPELHVDLHTRLADNPRLIPDIGLNSPPQLVEVVRDVRLPTLRTDELFAYLCVHGASSAWFRLKWITDVAALLHRRGADEIERLYQRSQELGAGRAATQALLLADALYGTLAANRPLRKSLSRDRAGSWLARAVLNGLSSPPDEPTSRPLGTALIHWSQFFLLPGIGFKASEFLRQARTAIR
jgi:hypothetical protein